MTPSHAQFEPHRLWWIAAWRSTLNFEQAGPNSWLGWKLPGLG